MNVLGAIRKVLTVLTDVLLIGRKQGWWKRTHDARPQMRDPRSDKSLGKKR